MTQLDVQPRILIVDDDAALARTLTRALGNAGYEVSCAPTGKDGIREVSPSDPDRLAAALVDVQLPDMNGLEVLREIRARSPHLGVIMMTGSLDTPTVVAALNQGAVAYIQKPFELDELAAVVAKTLDHRALVLENRELVRRLQHANGELEDRVVARSAELQDVNAKLADTVEMLRHAYDAKSRFVAMVSHELKTPMQSIIMATGTLKDHGDRLDERKKLRLLGIISDDAHRLARLVTSVLDLSRLQESDHEQHLGQTNVPALADEVLRRMQLAKSGLHCEVAFEPGTHAVVTDRHQVEQVLVNLIGNAVKYTPTGGSVRVTGKRQDSELVVCVADSGPGIPKAEREHVFDAFYRTRDAVNLKSPGTGLGLTITKAVVERLGGRIWLEGAEKGSRFFFSLPVEGRT